MTKRRTDLERKAPLATEGVQGYGESSANGGRTKTLIKTKKTKGFQPKILLNHIKIWQRHCFFDNASAVFVRLRLNETAPLCCDFLIDTTAKKI